MNAPHSQDKRIKIECHACGSHVIVHPNGESRAHARECLACPVCWAPGPGFEEALESGAAECDVDQGYRLLACVRPDGPELEGAPREMKELARMLWRLAGPD